MTPTDAVHQPGNEHGQDECFVLGASDIRAYLQRILDARCVLAGHTDGAATAQVTALLEVGDISLLVDVPRSDQVLQAWLGNPKLHFKTSLERISVSFATGPARLARHDGRPALSLPLPVRVLYQQRREYLRVAAPAGSLVVRVPARSGGEPECFDATILDISGSGLAMLVRGETTPFAAGDVLADCVLGLPHEHVAVDLLVRHVVPRHGRGPQAWQAGCEFIDLLAAIQDRLFRYVMHLERERMSRQRGWE